MPLKLSAQAVFQSNGSGNWNSNTWTLISGSDPNNRPDSNDDVIILPGHTITANRNEACNNLEFRGGTLNYSGSRSVTVNGNLTVTANSTVTGFSANQSLEVLGNVSVDAGDSFSFPSITLSIAGSTTVNGSMTIAGFSRVRDFGNVTINSGGTFELSGGNTYNFNGNLTNNGTFTANSFNQIFNFNSSSGSIAGANQINIFEANFTAPSNYTNTGNLLIRDNMSGTGSFTNGSGGLLTLTNSGPFTVSTFDASAVGNNVTYTGFGNPTGFNGSYYNLTLNKSSGNLGFSGAPSILNDLTIQDGILEVGAVTLTVGNDLNLEGGEFTPNNASGITNIGGDFNITGGQYDHNSGTVNVTGNTVMNDGEILFSGSGSIINISGNFTYDGGTANLQGGDFITNDFLVTSGNEIFINGVNLTVGGQVELDGTMTFNNTGGSKSIGSVLVNSTGSWNVSQPNNVTINGDITNNGTFTGDPGFGTSIYTLTSSSGVISGSNPVSIRDILINSPASYTNQGTLTVANTFRGTGSFTNGTNATFTYSGNNSSGTNFDITNFTASAIDNTVVYAGLFYSQQWRTTTSVTNDYYNVNVNFNTGGYQRLELIADVRVNGTLTLTEGSPLLNGFDIEMAAGATILGGSATSFIRINSSGVVRQYFSTTGENLAFPVGDNTNFSPITSFTLNSATLGANPFLEIDVIDANHPNRDTDNTSLGGNDDGTPAIAYISRYWTLNSNDISSPNYDVSYQYIDADITGTEANMIAALYGQPPGETFFDWKETGTVNATDNTATIEGANYWGDLYAMDNTLDRLPVELISFEAVDRNSTVILKWVTTSEVDNNYFIVERSQDGINFQEIGTVQGSGTTNNLQTYLFNDRFPPKGRVYYRLKQIDFNGQDEKSGLVTLTTKKTDQEIQLNVYPNPAQDLENIHIEFTGLQDSSVPIILRIIDGSGKVIFNQETQIDKIDTVRFPKVSKGIYFIQAININFKLSKRLVIH